MLHEISQPSSRPLAKEYLKMNYYYCEHCEVPVSGEDLLYHVMICDNFTQIQEEEYERLQEEST